MKSEILMCGPAFAEMPETEKLVRFVHERFFPRAKKNAEEVARELEEKEKLGLGPANPNLHAGKGAAESMACFISHLMNDLEVLSHGMKGKSAEKLNRLIYCHTNSLAALFYLHKVYEGLEERMASELDDIPAAGNC